MSAISRVDRLCEFFSHTLLTRQQLQHKYFTTTSSSICQLSTQSFLHRGWGRDADDSYLQAVDLTADLGFVDHQI